MHAAIAVRYDCHIQLVAIERFESRQRGGVKLVMHKAVGLTYMKYRKMLAFCTILSFGW